MGGEEKNTRERKSSSGIVECCLIIESYRARLELVFGPKRSLIFQLIETVFHLFTSPSASKYWKTMQTVL